jgi:hypothetical protein
MSNAKFRTLLGLITLSLAMNVGLGYHISTTRAAAASQSYIPVVLAPETHAAEKSVCDGKAPLLYKDTGSLAAGLTADGHFVVAYQSRGEGSKIRMAAHISNTLTEDRALAPWLPRDTVISQGEQSEPGASPSWLLTPIKGGTVAIVISPHRDDRVYFTQRTPRTPNRTRVRTASGARRSDEGSAMSTATERALLDAPIPDMSSERKPEEKARMVRLAKTLRRLAKTEQDRRIASWLDEVVRKVEQHADTPTKSQMAGALGQAELAVERRIDEIFDGISGMFAGISPDEARHALELLAKHEQFFQTLVAKGQIQVGSSDER